MIESDIAIIGAGPAGLIAAIEASQSNTRIVILEKMDRPGRKLEISGKGRCNITNQADMESFLSHFGKNGRFLRQAFSYFFNTDLIAYLSEMGIQCKLERGGRYFLESDDARELVEGLLKQIHSKGIQLFTRSAVRSVKKINQGFEVDANQHFVRCEKLLVATGGKSYPGTGSSGDGYHIAKSLGLQLTPILPALVPLRIQGSIPSHIGDLELKNVQVSVWLDKSGKRKKAAVAFGEIAFRSYGVTGPVILTLSKGIVESLSDNIPVFLQIDFKPALDHPKLDSRILREIKEAPKQAFRFLLSRLLPAKMISVFSDILNISLEKRLNQLNAGDRKRLRLLLKSFELSVSGYLSFNQAVITSGGISLREVESRTMASKTVPGLYLAGEVLDLDADTGGYNLQAAFSTGWLAGRSMRMS